MNINRIDLDQATLLEKLMVLLSRHRSIFSQERIYHRVVALVMAEIFAFARHTVTQLLLTLGIVDDDWTAWYRLFSAERFPEAAAAGVLLEAVLDELPVSERFMTAFDGFQVARTSQKMPGTSWLKALGTAPFKPGIQRGQRYVEGSWLTPLENGYSRAVPLRCLTAFPPKAVASGEPCRKEWEGGWCYLSWLRDELDGQQRQQQRIVALADGSFDTVGMWAELPERVDLVVRTARNRALYHLPQPHTGRGRPALYGPQAPSPAAWLQQRQGFEKKTVTVRGLSRTMRYRLEGPFVRDALPHKPLFLLVIGGGKRPAGSRRKQYQPCFFLVSARLLEGQWQLPLPIEELLVWLWQRWEVEVCHRQLKSNLGLGEKQCWHPVATVRSVQWSVWVYGLMVLAGYQAWGLNGGPAPPGRWRTQPRRWSFNTLWRGYRAAFWSRAEFRTSWSSTPDNWGKKEPFFAALDNAILAASRA